MADLVQLLRSLFFNACMYIAMLVLAVVYFPYALVSRKGARAACLMFCRWVIWSASWMIGLKTEVRGTPPTGEALVAAKHQSFFDIIVIFRHVPAAKFIMKRELVYAPLLGQYALRIGSVPVNRGKRGAAIEKMLKDVAKGRAEAGQLIIYPQGTRIAPGVNAPYKIGSGLLYEQLGQPCYPVATNIGVFWPKRGFMRRPGTAVVEFLPPIEPGLDKQEFNARLAEEIESRSNELMAEAGFKF